MHNEGYIYILTNSADNNAVKVGRTIDLRRRIAEHNGASNVVGVWTVHWSIEVPDTKHAEALALNSLGKWKVPGRREQFRCSPQKAKVEVSVALAEWSSWGREEKARRAEREAHQQEVRRRTEKLEAEAKAAQKRKHANEQTFELLCRTYPQRKEEYDRAKRIIAGTEKIPYRFKTNDLYLFALLILGIYYYATGTEPWEWARIIVAVAYGYGFVAFFDVQDRFKTWRDAQDHSSYLGRIENFETVYPDGVPPKSADDLSHLRR